MIRLNMRAFFNEDSDFINLDSIRNALAMAGHPLQELVDDMDMLKKLLDDSSSHETSHTALTDRLRDGWIVDLFVGHRKGVDPDISNNMIYSSTWVNSRFTIAFCKPKDRTVDKIKVVDLKAYFTQPDLYVSEIRKFWSENQAPIADFVGSLNPPIEGWDIHSFMGEVERELGTPYVCDSESSYLILGKLIDIASYTYANERLQKLVYDTVLSKPDRDSPFVVVSLPKPVDSSKGRFYHDRYTEQQQREQRDPWGHVTNDMLAHLLSHFSLTQIHPFQPYGDRVQVPSGLELVELIQSRLMPPDYRGGQPFAAFNQFFDPRFSGGFRPFPRCWNSGLGAMNGFNLMPNPFNAPQASNGYYTRHCYTGAWTWYPNTPVFVVLNVDRTDDSPQKTLDKLLHKILENMGTYGQLGERHIPDMVKEIKATLENHPNAMSLLLNDQVTLFVGERKSIQPRMHTQTDNYYTNWLLADEAWNPLEEYRPINVIQCIEGVAKYIPGYMDDRFGGMPPHMY